MRWVDRGLEGLLALLASWRFPVLVASALVASSALVVGILLVPSDAGPLGRFADDFRTWCLGWDPSTGHYEWSLVGVFVAQPLVLAAVTLGVWKEPVLALRASPGKAVPWATAGLLLALATAAAMGALPRSEDTGDLPFPAAALRTAVPAPELRLADQDGATVDLAALRGHVVLVTAVYARCGSTCPMILGEAKRAIEALSPEERADVTVVGVTLDPAHDTADVRGEMARNRELAAPTWRLVGGDVATVEATLDRLGFTRSVDPVSGVIDHANLFVLVDRDGKIAYRLTVGERQERWLVDALHTLLAERSRG